MQQYNHRKSKFQLTLDLFQKRGVYTNFLVLNECTEGIINIFVNIERRGRGVRERGQEVLSKLKFPLKFLVHVSLSFRQNLIVGNYCIRKHEVTEKGNIMATNVKLLYQMSSYHNIHLAHLA